MKKNAHLCIFDLDGTLVDSLRDIAEAFNECLELLGLPAHAVERYRYMVGEGVPQLCQRAVGRSHPHLVARLIELARPRYRARPLRHTRPYAGVEAMICGLHEAGVALAVLSNKPHDMTVRIVREFWPNDTFALIQGYTEEHLRKPDPHFIVDICRRLACPLERAFMIGDTPTDIETARRARITGVGVTWGFRTREDLLEAGAEHILDTPEQVGDYVLSVLFRDSSGMSNSDQRIRKNRG